MDLHPASAQKVPVRIDLLGPFRVAQGGDVLRLTSRKAVALAGYLARRHGRIPRDSLAALLWPDSGDGQARASLRQALAALRRELGAAAGIILAEDDAVMLRRDRTTVDATEFDQFARAEDPVGLDAAQALWRGDLLEGIGAVSPEFDRWLAAERSQLRAGLESVLLRLCDHHAAAGQQDAVIATALRLLALDPLQEHVHRRIIAAYRQQQRFDAALRQFDSLSRVLAGELGVSPEPATVELIRAVRRQRAGTSGDLPAPAASPAPQPAAPTARPSIAVLPLIAAATQPDALLLGEGIAEEVIVNLSRDRGLMVVSRQSSFHPEIAQAAPAEIGARLGVRFVLSGSARLSGRRFRANVHLARCTDGVELWAQTYDRDVDDVFGLQSDIARMVMVTAIGRITEDASETASVDPDVWRLGLLGLRHIHCHTPADMQRAIGYLTQAVGIDADNSRALGLLALATLYDRWNYGMRTDVADLLPLAARAVARDSRDSRARCALALACLLTRDHDLAGHHFFAGLAANPNDDLLMIEYGRYLAYTDRPEEALSRVREAMRLNPLRPDWYWNIRGRCQHLLGRHADALDSFRHIAEPAFYHFAYMAACHRALGDDTAAEGMRRRLFAAAPDFDVARFMGALPFQNPATAARFAAELTWLKRAANP